MKQNTRNTTGARIINVFLFTILYSFGLLAANAQQIYPPTDLTASNLTANTAQVNWQYNPQNVASFDIVYRQPSANAFTFAGNHAPLNPPTGSFVITGLQPNTTYIATIITQGNDGDSVPDVSNVNGNFETVTFTTNGTPPVCPTDIYETNNTRSSARQILSGTTVQANVCPDLSDEDYYFFTFPAKGYTRVTLSNLPTNYDLQIFDEYGILRGSSSNAGTRGEVIVHNVLQSTFMTIRVYAGTGAVPTSAPYSLTVETSRRRF